MVRNIPGFDNPHSTMHGVRYELHTMLIAGLGIALVPKFFVDGQLEQLGIIIPFGASQPVDSAYYLVYPMELSHGKPPELFRAWLLEQADAYNAAIGQ